MTSEIYIEDLCSKNFLSDSMQKLIEDTVIATLRYEEIDKACFVSVSIVDEDEIKSLNALHRGIDSVTDVLSFPVVNLIDGSDVDNPGDYYEGRLILGDVVLCAQRALEQSGKFGHTPEREMGYLTCHSILHLIGYDHENEDEREIMRQKEEAVMSSLKLER